MKKIFVIISFLSIIFSCTNQENYKNCLDESLIKKLDVFKKELLDSIPSLKKDVSVNAIALRVLLYKNKIALNKIEFTDKEIKNLKICLHDTSNILSDSLYINKIIDEGIKPDISNLVLSFMENDNDYLMLFWLYHIIDKNFVLVVINVINDETILVNGEKTEQISDIGDKIIFLRQVLDSNSQKFQATTLKAHKDSVTMYTINEIERTLIKVGALKAN